MIRLALKPSFRSVLEYRIFNDISPNSTNAPGSPMATRKIKGFHSAFRCGSSPPPVVQRTALQFAPASVNQLSRSCNTGKRAGSLFPDAKRNFQ